MYAGHRGIKNVAREPSWCQRSSLGIALSWLGNPTDQNGLLLKHYISSPFPVLGITILAHGKWNMVLALSNRALGSMLTQQEN